jgi:hypothetical protein
MKTISHFLPILIGLAVAAFPVTGGAKTKKDEHKKDAPAMAETQKKPPEKRSEKSTERSASRGKKVAGTKNSPAKEHAANSAHAPKGQTASSSKRAKIKQEKRDRTKQEVARHAEHDRPAAGTNADKKRHELSGVKSEGGKKRAGTISETNEESIPNNRTDTTASHRDDSRAGKNGDRAERREARQETAEQQAQRADRLREKERILQQRKRQIAERREHLRDRVERFRNHRNDRLNALARQRRAIRATRAEARREYVHDVREEIRDYWHDRADETRYRIGDRYDNLFDDDWWEHRHWHHGPVLVSDPWWWWRPAQFGAINLFIEAGWNEPIAYDYGTDLIYDGDLVEVRGEPMGTRAEYSRQIVQLANPVSSAVANAPVSAEEWRPLGVWALVQEAKGDAIMFFQLSVDRQGLISGAYTNVVSGEALPVAGQVDRATQRAAWHVGDQTTKVFEAGLANLTEDQASCLVHVAPGEMQTWLLVRLPEPTLPSEIKKLGEGRSASYAPLAMDTRLGR